MNWNSSGDRPAYQQIMAAIRGAILTGELDPDEKPSLSVSWWQGVYSHL